MCSVYSESSGYRGFWLSIIYSVGVSAVVGLVNTPIYDCHCDELHVGMA